MSLHLLIPLLFVNSTVYGQTNEVGTNEIRGLVVDSINNEPVVNSIIATPSGVLTLSDFDGRFDLKVVTDSVISLLVSYGNTRKTVLYKRSQLVPFIIRLSIPPYYEDTIPRGNVIDTSYYESQKIKTIRFQYRDELYFYESGSLKSRAIGGSYWEWYKNGHLKYHSIQKNPHYIFTTSWYNNGRINEEGGKYWGHNPKTNEGDWLKREGWKYWWRNGKEKVRR